MTIMTANPNARFCRIKSEFNFFMNHKTKMSFNWSDLVEEEREIQEDLKELETITDNKKRMKEQDIMELLEKNRKEEDELMEGVMETINNSIQKMEIKPRRERKIIEVIRENREEPIRRENREEQMRRIRGIKEEPEKRIRGNREEQMRRIMGIKEEPIQTKKTMEEPMGRITEDREEQIQTKKTIRENKQEGKEEHIKAKKEREAKEYKQGASESSIELAKFLLLICNSLPLNKRDLAYAIYTNFCEYSKLKPYSMSKKVGNEPDIARITEALTEKYSGASKSTKKGFIKRMQENVSSLMRELEDRYIHSYLLCFIDSINPIFTQ